MHLFSCNEKPMQKFFAHIAHACPTRYSTCKRWTLFPNQEIHYNINWRDVHKECCKQSKDFKFKGTVTKWPVQKPTHMTTQKHIKHEDATDIQNKKK